MKIIVFINFLLLMTITMSGVIQTRRKYVCLLHTTPDIYKVNVMLLSDSR